MTGWRKSKRWKAVQAADQQGRGVALRGVAWSVLLAALLWQPGWARAEALQVPSREYPTIGAALRQAPPGARIAIAAGVYTEQLRVRRPVSLQPQPGAEGQVIIQGGGQGRIMEIWAEDVQVRGLRLQGSGERVDPPDACLYAHKSARGLVVNGNDLSDCAFGIWVNGTPDVRIENNRVSGRKKPVFSDMGNGIHLWSVERALVRGNRVHNVRDGIYISVSKDSAVLDNRMWKLRFGIHYMYNDDNRIEGNLTCNSMVGLAMMFSKRLSILGNVAVNNQDHGMFFRSIFNSDITGNRAEENARGMVLNEASFNTITENHVAGNATGVVVTGGSEDNQITGNNFMGNPLQVQYTWRRPMYWDREGEGNYWGDYLGYDVNRDGRGDVRYFSANRVDWLVNRYPQLKLLADSPLVRLMQGLESRFPVLRPAGVVDRAPFMQPHDKAASIPPGPEMDCGGILIKRNFSEDRRRGITWCMAPEEGAAK